MSALTVAGIIKFIKRRLGVPAVSLELDDETIKDIIIEDTLPVYTQYCPDIGHILIDKEDLRNRVHPDDSTLFWVTDPDNKRILDIVNVYIEWGSLLASGYPYLNIPMISYDQIDDFALKISETKAKNLMSKADVTWEQHGGINQVRIFGENSLSNLFKVEYTREHADDLSTIPIRMEPTFKDLSLAFTMISVGNIRKKYSGIETPIGSLTLTSEIYEEGIQLRDRVIEELKVQEPPITPIFVG